MFPNVLQAHLRNVPGCTSNRCLQSSSNARGVRPSKQHAHGRSSKRSVSCKVVATDEEAGVGAKYILSNGLVDYYEVLGVDDDASYDEIKKAYRALAKECHPDYLGDRGHDICILLNEAYQVLSAPESRDRYNAKLEQALFDEEEEYTGEALSKWMPTVNPKMAKNTDPKERRAVFVDEVTCIGCKQCVWCASATFRMEQEHGRSRVFAQWLDSEEKIQQSIDSCPVSCIHWVDRADLPALEYVMQKKMTERVNVGVMMAGQGATMDVFSATAQFLKERKRKEEAKAREKAARAYTPEQEAARRRAANSLRQQNQNVFGRLGSFFEDAMYSMQQTVAGAVTDNLTKVGGRKRAVRWDARSQRAAAPVAVIQGYTVPPERALVPISVYAEERAF